jgi:hypothetical protein
MSFWIGWAATTPPELAIGILIFIIIGLILAYAILRAEKKPPD